ncbi:MAG: hypothetical protein U0168_17690 [Nannocystaceae bacterium]
MEQRLVGHHAEAELIAALVGGHTEPLLGRHVARRALACAGAPRRIARAAGAALARRLDGSTREPEVHHAHALARLADHDVVGLDVAVDQPRRVRGRETVGDRAQLRQHLGPVSRPQPQPLCQGLTPHQIHRDPHATVAAADVVDRDHVGVIEPRERLGLAHQSRALLRRAFGIGGRTHHLDRNAAIELGVPRREHHAHAAGTHTREHDVAAQGLAGRQRDLGRERRRRAAFGTVESGGIAAARQAGHVGIDARAQPADDARGRRVRAR